MKKLCLLVLVSFMLLFVILISCEQNKTIIGYSDEIKLDDTTTTTITLVLNILSL